ncbi:FG-GAP-like repeat-containing protein [Streptomyces ficellus]|uniref:FG-GAP-like repeat-containing protein n=1 Tax=Streptomyces ficellus TaxID=1977088 RepID=A0ABT7ZC89_9ACTN|nr:FG-GAP-like repeat-containing protein [Streptomyces ficellus]MDN3297055.1 FG-GAP-like repeat-containing protein [Streptomyces ficellus]
MATKGLPQRRHGRIVASCAALSVGLATLGFAASAAEPDRSGTGHEAAVSALAKATASGRPVEVVERRTESSETYVNPSGTVTVTRHMAPVRVRQGGRWVPVDTALVSREGRVEPKAAAAGLELSDGGRGPVVRLNDDRHVLELTWPGELPKPKLAGPVATYAEVLPGVDLQVTAEAEGFSQLLVVKDAKAAKNPKLKKIAYGLEANGLKVTGDDKQGLKAVDTKGRTVFSGPAPRMWDSAKGPRKEAAMQTEVTAGGLTVVPDQKLLTGPDTTYPVHIDPSFTRAPAAWSQLSSYRPTESGWMYGHELQTGQYQIGSSYPRQRAFFQVDVPYLAGRQVLNASLTLKDMSWYTGDCAASTVELWHTGRATPATTWNNQAEWKTKLASAGCPAGTLTFNALGAAQAAARAGTTIVDLGLRGSPAAETPPTQTIRRFEVATASLTVEIAYNGECFLRDQVAYEDPDGNAFHTEMSCEAQASDVRIEPYAASQVTGRLLAGPHGFVCWRSGDLNGAGNRIWYYVKGDTSTGWTSWQGWGYVPADKITGAGSVPFPGLPACNVHTVTPGLVAPQDFNSDGLTDVVALQSDGNAALHPGNGNGTLANKRLLWSDGRGNGYKEIFTADFNADGRGDVAAVDGDNRVWWWPGDGDGGLTGSALPLTDDVKHAHGVFAQGSPPRCRDFVSTDVNGDGKGDILAACGIQELDPETEVLWWWRGNGDGEYVPGAHMTEHGFEGSVITLDSNGDGRMDVAEHVPDGRLLIQPGYGDGHWDYGTVRTWPAAGFGPVSKAFAGDFNGDRRGDLAAVDASGSLWWWAGDGNGAFAAPSKMSAATDWGTAKDLM